MNNTACCVFVRQIPAHLMLRIERCWATPTNDPYSNIQYTFIRDRWVRIQSLPTGTGNNNNLNVFLHKRDYVGAAALKSC